MQFSVWMVVHPVWEEVKEQRKGRLLSIWVMTSFVVASWRCFSSFEERWVSSAENESIWESSSLFSNSTLFNSSLIS